MIEMARGMSINDEMVVAAAQCLKKSAEAENVYIGLGRARRMIEPVLKQLAKGEAGADAQRAVASPARRLSAGASATPGMPLAKAVERLREVARQHDLSDLDMRDAPEDLRAVLAAYADCQEHLAAASELLGAVSAAIAARGAPRPAPVRHQWGSIGFMRRAAMRANGPARIDCV